jgi:large subunit ribosomal protein L35
MANKAKSHRGAAKRIRLSGSGKLIRRHSHGNHFLAKKSSARKRTIASSEIVAGSAATKQLKRLLGA